ncbi:hypothetical protein [Asticcacaulis sp. W401b]|uniref:hypothetical protein n=1 Tax=Asticcacaulis sp. W401b TaxID=3388666 RepID=UPI003970DB94
MTDFTAIFFEKLCFENGSTMVCFSTPEKGCSEYIKFEFVRRFLFLKESEYWSISDDQDKELLISNNNGSVSIYLINSGSVIENSFSDDLKNERPYLYSVMTSDECFEVACFSEPSEIIPSKKYLK